MRNPLALAVAVGLSLLTGCTVATHTDLPPAPPTPVRPVTEVLHGEVITDPYRWLEGDAAGKMTPEVAAWTDAQNARTRAYLDGWSHRGRVEARLKELLEVRTLGAPRQRGNRYFNTVREPGQKQPILYVRDGLASEPRVLLDLNKVDPTGLTSLDFYDPDRSGKILAYGTSNAGDESTTLRFLDVETGKTLDLVIGNRVDGVSWLPDSSGFVYSNREVESDPYSRRVRFHKMGSAVKDDAVLLAQYADGPHAKTYGPGGDLSHDGKWLVLSYSTGTRSNDLWVADFAAFLATGKLEKRAVITGAQSQTYGSVYDGKLYLQTNDGAPNGKLVVVDPANPQKANWKEVIPERKDAVMAGTSFVPGQIVVTWQVKAQSAIERFDRAGKSLGLLALPGIGSASLRTEEDTTNAFLVFTSFNYPTTIFQTDLASPTLKVWSKPKFPVDPESIVVKQVTYTSRDATPVTMFIVHRKDVVLDGNNPTVLYGYGGFGVGMTPYFSSSLFVWLEAGGVYAIPNLRGGDEYGDEWHAAGQLGRKQNVYDDFIAAAAYLNAHGYSNPSRLAVSGGSNGGLLTGAVLVQRPDLFAAVVSDVPLLDMLRYQSFLMGEYWVPEYGTAADAGQYKFLRAYSPYHNVVAGTKYPAVFLTAGENDVRVHPLHARKMAALLQASTASDAAKSPVLLWVDRSAGHGGGKPMEMIIRDEADSWTFLMRQLGVTPK